MPQDLTEQATVHFVVDDESVRFSLCGLMMAGLEAKASGTVPDFPRRRLKDGLRCFLLGVRLPSISEFEFQGPLRTFRAFFSAVLMTRHGDLAMSVCAKKSGAVVFLPKTCRDQIRLDAVISAIGPDCERCTSMDQAADIYDRFANADRR